MKNENQGWIKLHRELIDKAIWRTSTPEQKAILVTILLMANHADNQWYWQGKKFTCKPGQFITSSSKLAEKAGVTRQNARTALKKFEQLEFLTSEPTNQGTLVTIVNWEKYQAKPEVPTSDSTNDQPAANQRPTNGVTTNKNKKNEKKRDSYTPEFETWYSSWPRPQAKQDSLRNFEKVRKERGLSFLLECSKNYIAYWRSIPERDRPPAYSSNNFFGQKAYYLDFVEPKKAQPAKGKYSEAPM